MIISTDAKKIFDKIQKPYTVRKNLSKAGISRDILHLTQGTY